MIITDINTSKERSLKREEILNESHLTLKVVLYYNDYLNITKIRLVVNLKVEISLIKTLCDSLAVN